MKKTFMGVKLRKLRAEHGLSQIALAHALGLSPSYLNQLEQNQRPLTVSVLLKLNRALGVDIQQFSEDEEARLVAGLREALAEAPESIALPELQEVAAQMPALGRAVMALHRRHLEALERIESMSLRLGDDSSDMPVARTMPFEAVRDFFFAHQNYFDEVDRAAQALAGEARADPGHLADWLVRRLQQRHGVQVHRLEDSRQSQRRFDPATRSLWLSSALEPAQQAFQLGTQLALLEMGDTLDRLIATAAFQGDPASSKLARVGLANYFAGALLLPYDLFLESAEQLRYDIDLLGQRFGVGFETVCHRLSTLQRPGAPGVPFFFVRGHAFPLQPHRRHLPAVDGVRGLRPARPGAAPARQHARRAALPVDCTLGLAWSAGLWFAAQDLLHRPGLRHTPCLAPGLCQGAGPGRSGIGHAHRHGLQGLRARPVHAARLSLCGKGAACG